ncbi:hypothetical protein WA026_004066 [Henosepilachna vigintioctopunctata]|uniref:Uncharacterized protein n=1 Tax=Henosepilachna vigintioctopunctata TaxID=420089 RepID=A0AAW1U6F4_9CUCU
MMGKYMFILCLASCYIIVSSKVNLKCDSTNSNDACRCDIAIDPLTNFPVSEAVCEYLELEDFPSLDLIGPINSLDLSHNNLKVLKHLESIRNDGPIFILKICHNSIVEIDENFFFDYFPNITTLDMSFNNLTALKSTALFDKLNDLQDLNLSFNQIGIIQDGMFANLKNLLNIDLSYNPLFNILQDPNALLDKLGINENIVKFNLNNVGVTRIHEHCWNKFKNMEHLSVADNPLTEIPQTSASLEYLDISGTNITDIHENYLKYSKLKVLIMSRMQNLRSIPKYAFYNLGNLEEFSLTDSLDLQDFNALSFGALDRRTFPRHLRKFNLARNRIRTLNESYQFLFHETEYLDVSFNKWECNCDVLWMKDLDYLVRRKNYIRCAAPGDTVNKLVLKLQPMDVPDCYPEIYGKKFHQTTLVFMILLVFALIAIIVYLCLYSPSWSTKIGSTRVSPDSPYSINNES